MATYIFNGEYPSSIKQAFIDTYKLVPQPSMRETRVWWSDDPMDFQDYLIEGEVSYQTVYNQIPNFDYAYKVEFGSAVTCIGENAIQIGNCQNLKSISIPGSVETISSYAFLGDCSTLKNITLGNGILEIKEFAFNGLLQSLSSINIPNSVMHVGAYAFNIGSENLFDITTVPNAYFLDGWIVGYNPQCTFDRLDLTNVHGIADEAFNCANIQQIIIPDTMLYIGYDAFLGCENVTDISCYANPNNLAWDELDCNDFKEDGSTICHVRASDLAAYQSKFGGEVNVQFVGDLT